MRRRALLVLLTILSAVPARGEASNEPGEPGFCAPDVFLAHEIPEASANGVKRLRAFRLGAVVLAGMAVGESVPGAVARLAGEHGSTAADRYCTWYVNRGNREAEARFRHVYLPNPRDMTPARAGDAYGDLFGPALDDGPGGLWQCLEEEGYAAVGCNGQMHRGPTAFGMVLAALGCSPEHAADIVNRLWGLNDVPEANRLAAIRRGYEIGTSQPELRARLQRLLSQ